MSTAGTKEVYVEDPETGEEFEIEVKWSLFGKYVPAKLYGPPEDCYPAEYPEFEIEAVTLTEFGKVFALSEDDLTEAGVDLEALGEEVQEEVSEDFDEPEPDWD